MEGIGTIKERGIEACRTSFADPRGVLRIDHWRLQDSGRRSFRSILSPSCGAPTPTSDPGNRSGCNIPC
jgi:hypothetical protein